MGIILGWIKLPGDLVAEFFARYDGDFLANSLVGVEVQTETSIVLLDEGLGGLLDRLGSNTSLLNSFTIELNRTLSYIWAIK